MKERDYEIFCTRCGSSKLYLFTEELRSRKWRQTSSVFNRKEGRKFYFAISSSDPDFAHNDERKLERISLICENCGLNNTTDYSEIVEQSAKDFG